MTIRYAEPGDIARMVHLSEAKRSEYQPYSPVYWRKAANAAELQTTFFKKLLKQHDWIPLVHEGGNGLDGYVIGHIASSPPVYDMGGKACLIHDFVVENPDLWSSVGARLSDGVNDKARARGAVVSVVVCGAHDMPKRRFLLDSGTHVASEWHVRPLVDEKT